MNKNLRIVFLGTPEFAVPSLDILFRNNYNVVGVITVPDKPAGRGQQLQQSAVKEFARKNNLKVFQPVNLKDESFLKELKSLNVNLQIVVAFRMLPEVVWQMPSFGTFNLHASLLPQYRGAAPINWAIINGENETGITTFFLKHQIDTGNIIFQTKTCIGENETAGELHDKLMMMGADLVLKTVRAIEQGTCPQIKQNALVILKHAPKIFKDDCKINWNKTAAEIHNFIRGLNPYPTAFTELISAKGEKVILKVFNSELPAYRTEELVLSAGRQIPNSLPTERKNSFFRQAGELRTLNSKLETDNKTYLRIKANDEYVYLTEVQAAGKKRMKIEEFLRGYKLNNEWSVS